MHLQQAVSSVEMLNKGLTRVATQLPTYPRIFFIAFDDGGLHRDYSVMIEAIRSDIQPP